MGARQSVDSEFYITNAKQISQGILPQGRAIWYSSFSFFLASVFALGGNLKTVVFLQIILAHVSGFFIYLITKKLFGRSLPGVIAAGIYLLWIPIQEWNTFIYTESLFTSMCILSFASLVFCRNWKGYILCALFFLFAFFIRPTGFSLLVGLMGYSLMAISKSGLRTMIGISLFIAALLVGSKMFQFYDPIPSYTSAEIIYPKISLGVKPNSNLEIPNSESVFKNVFLFALYNPVYFIKLFIIKTALYFGNIKPYYSTIHNILIVLCLYPLYCLALCSFWIKNKSKREQAFILFFILTNGIIVGLTTENWDGRFLVPVLPFVFILAAGNLVHLLGRYVKNSSPILFKSLTYALNRISRCAASPEFLHLTSLEN